MLFVVGAIVPPAIGAAITTAFLLAAGYAIRYVLKLQADQIATIRHDAVDGAKDELIDTLERNHKALVDRVETLEGRADHLARLLNAAEGRASGLQASLDTALAKVEDLRQYTAPEAVRRFQAMFDAFAHSTTALLTNSLERTADVEKMIEAIHEHTEALVENARLLREYRRNEDLGPPLGQEERRESPADGKV